MKCTERSETACRKAIEQDPSYSQAHHLLGGVLTALGRHEEARRALARARELDLYPMQYAISAHVEFLAHDYSSAVAFATQATALDPSFWIGSFQLAMAYERLGKHELALEVLKRAEVSGGNSKMVSLRGATVILSE